MTDGPAKSLREAVGRLDAAGLVAEARKPAADVAEAVQVAQAVDHRRQQATRFPAAGLNGPAVAGVYGGRRRLALALGGPEDSLPGWIGERLDRPHGPAMLTAGDAPVAARRSADTGDLLPGMPPQGIGALMVIAGTADTPATLALVGVQHQDRGRLEIRPVPWRSRRAVQTALADGRPAALVFGAPPAAALAAGLAGGMVGDPFGLSGAVAAAAVPFVLPANDAPPVPAEAEFAVYGALEAGAEDGSAATLAIAGICSRADPILHLMAGTAQSREQLALEALAAETILQRHVATVEGGVDVIDVVVFPETGNRVAALKIRPRIGGQSKTALMAALSSPHLAPEIAIGVDEDVAVADLRDVVWSMASRLHGEIDVATIGGMAMAGVDRWPAAGARAGTKWFVDSTMPPLTQAEKREAFARAIPKNLAKVRLSDFLPDE